MSTTSKCVHTIAHQIDISVCRCGSVCRLTAAIEVMLGLKCRNNVLVRAIALHCAIDNIENVLVGGHTLLSS